MVHEPHIDQCSLLCIGTAISAPRLMRAWTRHRWIEHSFLTLKHLLATEACPIPRDEAYDGHLVLRLMGCFVRFDTARDMCHGRMTMEASIFSLTHDGHVVDGEALELQALSLEVEGETA
jgi:hypothetical protein